LEKEHVRSSNHWKFSELARLLTDDPQATPAQGVRWLSELCERLHISRLAAYGVTSAAVPGLVKQAQQASSMKGNPVELPVDVLFAILLDAM
jgi:alcohol dehydrogenase class IV